LEQMKKRVVIICTGNSCRSQMAEALLRRHFDKRVEVLSAGTAPASEVHPMAIDAMHEIGCDISAARPKSLRDLPSEFDLTITVCDSANESCPVVPGRGRKEHLSFRDPAVAMGSYEERRAAFRGVRDDLKERLIPLAERMLREDEASGQAAAGSRADG